MTVSLAAAAFPNMMAKRIGNQELIELTAGKLGAWVASQPDRGSDGTMLYPEERHARAAQGNKGNLTAKIRGGDIIINGQNNSLWTKDGVTTMENFKAGPMFLQISVADPPYRTPVQDLYQANTILDCAKPERNLALELGPVGDALLRWH